MKKLVVIFGLVCFFLPLQAAHIIGGELTYECISSGTYRFTLKLYRDCAGGGANFDGAPNAPFAATVSIFSGNSFLPFKVVNLTNPQVEDIPIAESNPCIVPPGNICVQSGVYTWVEQLPVTNETYTISYQRCCRNNTISNLVNPGAVGSTYSVEITPTAQGFCNSSPEFENLPPIVICSNQDLSFDFSATDVDGDVLVYSLCTPLTGGGNDTQNPFTYGGVAPDPDAAPPYGGVPFIPGQFSASNPMGGNPGLSINATSGLLTGFPTFTGQFVVGVCVEEYRNGELLSTVTRDFQFNVTTCQPTVVADINVDEIDDQGVYQIKLCGDSSVVIDNQSYQANFINDWQWSLYLPEDTLYDSDNWDPAFDLPGLGTYPGNLVLNLGLFCTDTLDFEITVFPGLNAQFDFVYDTCDYGPVTFLDYSVTGAGPDSLVSWAWDFGDGNEDESQNPIHIYEIPGQLPVQLSIEDTNGCTTDTTQIVEFFPVPDLIVLEPNRFVGCVPDSIFFLNLSVPIDSTYDILWDFGDDSFGTGVSPYHFYQDTGVFTVTLDITSPIGCVTGAVFPDLITMLPSAEAGFDYTPNILSNFDSEVSFIDESIAAAAYYWNFNNSSFSVLEEPTHTFVDTGLVEVTQIVTHQSGCRDTAYAILDIEPRVTYYLPNAFTPNLDGINDEYRGTGYFFGMKSFQIEIWNRYGELVFENSDPNEGWNGRKNNSGRESQEGLYVVFVEYITPRSERIKLQGYANLLR